MYGIEAEHSGIWMDEARELIASGGYDQKGWNYHYDGSVQSRGGESLELVSPILEHDVEARRDTRTLIDRVRNAGGTVDATCGLHVHHDASNLLPFDVFDIVSAYEFFQPAIDKILPASRRTSSDPEYCHPLDESDLHATLTAAKNATSMPEFRRDCQWWDRYRTVNVAALGKHGTLEFRQHSGTLNPRKIRHWVELTTAITTMHRSNSLYSTDTPDRGDVVGMLDRLDLTPVAKAFYLGRQAELQGAGDNEDQSQAEYPSSCNNCGCNTNEWDCDDTYGCQNPIYIDDDNDESYSEEA